MNLQWSPVGQREVRPAGGTAFCPEPPRKVVCWADPLGMVWAEEISAPPFKPGVLVAMACWLAENGYLCVMKAEGARTALLSRHNALHYVEIDEARHPR